MVEELFFRSGALDNFSNLFAALNSCPPAGRFGTFLPARLLTGQEKSTDKKIAFGKFIKYVTVLHVFRMGAVTTDIGLLEYIICQLPLGQVSELSYKE